MQAKTNQSQKAVDFQERTSKIQRFVPSRCYSFGSPKQELPYDGAAGPHSVGQGY